MENRSKSAKAIFTEIYETGLWGKSDELKYYSGGGSHYPALVEPYIEAVRLFLATLPAKPDAVDLGCGDFSVGSRIRPFCNNYTACDVVEPVITFNKEKYAGLNVDFEVIDLAQDDLPSGDIVFVRQVFQHLSNTDIQSALKNIVATYDYIIVTEHIPAAAPFVANIDKPTGAGVRADFNSGVVLTAAPFDLQVKETHTLCQVPTENGILATYAYQL